MVNYLEAIKRPFTDFKKFIIGILLGIIPIINFFVYGYEIECARTAIKKNFKLPEWKNFKKLFVNGFLSFVISFVYLIIPFVIFALAIGKYLMESQIAAQNQNEIIKIILSNRSPLLIISIVLLILALYIIPLATIKFAKNYKFKEAFSIKKIFKRAFTLKYFKVWIIMFLYSGLLSFLLSRIPFVGSSINSFISAVTLMTAIGEFYGTK